MTRGLGTTSPLFLSEAATAARLGLSAADWKAKAIVLERHGLPKVDALMGGRYWPAVETFFHRRAGLTIVGLHQPDGKENLDAF